MATVIPQYVFLNDTPRNLFHFDTQWYRGQNPSYSCYPLLPLPPSSGRQSDEEAVAAEAGTWSSERFEIRNLTTQRDRELCEKSITISKMAAALVAVASKRMNCLGNMIGRREAPASGVHYWLSLAARLTLHQPTCHLGWNRSFHSLITRLETSNRTCGYMFPWLIAIS